MSQPQVRVEEYDANCFVLLHSDICWEKIILKSSSNYCIDILCRSTFFLSTPCTSTAWSTKRGTSGRFTWRRKTSPLPSGIAPTTSRSSTRLVLAPNFKKSSLFLSESLVKNVSKHFRNFSSSPNKRFLVSYSWCHEKSPTVRKS